MASENEEEASSKIPPINVNDLSEKHEIEASIVEPIEIKDEPGDLNNAILIEDSDRGQSSDDEVVIKDYDEVEYVENDFQNEPYDEYISDEESDNEETIECEDEKSEEELVEADEEKRETKQKRKRKRRKARKHESIQYGFDPKKPMTPRRLFILEAMERLMHLYWPQPISDFYCRCCNYLEFENEEGLNKHNETEGHKKRQENKEFCYCLVCQVHTLNVEGMQKHRISEKHRELTSIFIHGEREAYQFYESHKDDKFLPADPEEKPDDNEAVEKKEELEPMLGTNTQAHFDRALLERDAIAAMNLYDYKEHTKAQYIYLICDVAMTPQITVPTDKLYCNVCNWMEFDTKEELVCHRATEEHAQFTRIYKYGCEFCKLHFISTEALNEHKKEKEHKRNKKMVNIVKSLVHQFRNKFILSDQQAGTTELNITFSDDVKPPYDDFIGPNRCELCYIQLPAKGKELHKTTKPHKNNLWKWFLEQQKEFVTLTGCKLCGIRLLNPGFFRASHANFIGHKNRLRKLKELIGLSTGEVLESPFSHDMKDKRARVSQKLILKKEAYLRRLEERERQKEESDKQLFAEPADDDSNPLKRKLEGSEINWQTDNNLNKSKKSRTRNFNRNRKGNNRKPFNFSPRSYNHNQASYNKYFDPLQKGTMNGPVGGQYQSFSTQNQVTNIHQIPSNQHIVTQVQYSAAPVVYSKPPVPYNSQPTQNFQTSAPPIQAAQSRPLLQQQQLQPPGIPLRKVPDGFFGMNQQQRSYSQNLYQKTY